jgi:ATP-dependent helicase/nuclease subunit B
MTAGTGPNVFSIPAGIPFARALARGLVQRFGDADPLALSEALIFVPTRRAVRSLREAFAESTGGAVLLPDIRALGDSNEEDFDSSTDDMAAAQAIAPLRRRLLLATLVERWDKARGGAAPFAQAVAHAGELARFLDETVTQGADLARLKTLAPEAFAEHWQEVLKFLDIVGTQWPLLLASEDKAEPATLRDAHLRALAAAMAARPPRGPVIAAGSTGSIPATAALLKTIAHLPNGAVVVPGLDRDLDAASWELLEPAHAQFGLRQLLAHIGIARNNVATWPHLAEGYAGREARVRFLAEALRPPPTTDAWRDLVESAPAEFSGALKRFSRVEAANPREEGLAIACVLRETLETPGRTAALVTPDRGLARRVAAELTRWNISIDDSAGQRLSATPPGAFLSLLARATAEDFAPVPLLALLKHPFASGGETRAEFLHRVRALEMFALRGLRPEPGLSGIAARLEKNRNATGELKQWFSALVPLFAPLVEAMRASGAALDDLARAHTNVAERLAATDSKTGADILWRGPAGEAAASLLNELICDGANIALRHGHWYAELFRALAEERAVRPQFNRHPRLAILGPLEARLIHFDLVILGGLNEGTWPAQAATDPWLSRPMREKLGLEPPERRTGLAAHDFATLAANDSVLLTRSVKDAGAPTVASRWLLRVEQLAKGLGLDYALDARSDLLRWARTLDSGTREKRTPRPAPRPPAAARPRTLSITEIETWLRDPYAIYAKHVLRFRPLDPLDQEAGPRERGIAIHRALEAFLKAFPSDLPEDALAWLLRLGGEAFADKGATESVLALWRPRFERAASWFLDYETARRASIARSFVEVKGDLPIASSAAFTLRGRADRIDIFSDGSAAILDYKTGRVPSDKQIDSLLAPQLPLEAAMLMNGAFRELRAPSVRELVHIRLTGGEREGEVRIAKVDANAKAAEALERLTRQVARYENPAQPYLSRAMPERLTDTGDYDHLARVAEWSLAEDGE